MKKILLIALAALFTLSAYSTTPDVVDYVVTDDGIEFFKKVRIGITNFIVAVKDDGTKVKYSQDEVLSYRLSGDVFVKNVYENKMKRCKECTFMKLLRSRHGFSIFMYTYNIAGQDLYKCLVYKDSEFVLEVDKENANQMIHFFSKRYL